VLSVSGSNPRTLLFSIPNLILSQFCLLQWSGDAACGRNIFDRRGALRFLFCAPFCRLPFPPPHCIPVRRFSPLYSVPEPLGQLPFPSTFRLLLSKKTRNFSQLHTFSQLTTLSLLRVSGNIPRPRAFSLAPHFPLSSQAFFILFYLEPDFHHFPSSRPSFERSPFLLLIPLQRPIYLLSNPHHRMFLIF